MELLIQKHAALWQNRDYLRSMIAGMLMLLTGLAAAAAAWFYLLRTNVHPVTPPDLFLDLLPVTGMENVLVWGVPLLLSFVICSMLLYPERIPLVLGATGALFLTRSFFVVLTPMGIRPDQAVTQTQGMFQQMAYGSSDFFFSGHVSFPFLLGLVFWNQPWIRITMFGASGIFAVAVLLAHTHYSIDVFSVPFIVPTIHRLSVSLFNHSLVPTAGWEQTSERTNTSPAFI